MNTLSNLTYSLLSHDWAGLLIAAVIGAVGAVLLIPMKLRWPGLAVLGVAALLAVGAVAHIAEAISFTKRFPAPGKFVEVEGMRIHVLAEGPRDTGRPTLVWFAGAHAPGAAIDHVHRAMRDRYRSVLIDRPGTGWSGPATFPRTTAGEAEEMWKALDRAGERGPFVLIGHSFGGLLAANMARRAPQRTHALILLDATPPDTIIYGPPMGAAEMSAAAFQGGLSRLFGIRIPIPGGEGKRLSPSHDALWASAMLPRSQMAGASIYRELSPEGMARVGWSTAVYDGVLGDMPVYLVAPGTMEDVASFPQVTGASPAERARMLDFFKRSRERYMAVSTRSERIYTPAGTTHNFPAQTPEAVVAAVEKAAQ